MENEYLIKLINKTNEQSSDYDKIDTTKVNLIKQDLNLYKESYLLFIDKNTYKVYILDLNKFILKQTDSYYTTYHLSLYFSFIKNDYDLAIREANNTFNIFFPNVDTSNFEKKHRIFCYKDIYIDSKINVFYHYIDHLKNERYEYSYVSEKGYIWKKLENKLHYNYLDYYNDNDNDNDNDTEKKQYIRNTKYDINIASETSYFNKYGKPKYDYNGDFNKELENVSDEPLIEKSKVWDYNDESDTDSNASYETIDKYDYGYFDYSPRKIKKSDARKINEYCYKIRTLFNEKQIRYLISNNYVSNLYFNSFDFKEKIDELNTIYVNFKFTTSYFDLYLIEITMWINKDDCENKGFASYVYYDVNTFTPCDENNINKKRAITYNNKYIFNFKTEFLKNIYKLFLGIDDDVIADEQFNINNYNLSKYGSKKVFNIFTSKYTNDDTLLKISKFLRDTLMDKLKNVDLDKIEPYIIPDKFKNDYEKTYNFYLNLYSNNYNTSDSDSDSDSDDYFDY